MIRRVLALTMVIAGSVALSSAAGASGHAAGARPDLSTRQAINSYLRTLGIDPASVVVQRGARNYAGPSCPGSRWNCTTARRVFQIASTVAGTNMVQCPGGSVSGQTCTIVQTGASNNATCVEKSGDPVVAQDCSITQTGSTNNASVQQSVDSTLSDVSQTQNSTQTAEVTQAGDSNTSSVSQSIHQNLHGGGSQQQDSHQNATVCQGGGTDCTVSNTGANKSSVNQSVFLEAHSLGPVTQNQDTSSTDGTCVSDGGSSPSDICASVTQNSTTTNNSSVNQSSHLLGQAAQANGSDVSQEQEHFGGGVGADVVQPDPGATNTSSVRQDINDDLHGPAGSSQSQDPRAGCCSGAAAAGGGNASVTQTGSLSTSEADAFQNLELDGSVGTNGSCNLSQKGTIDSGKDTEQDSENGFCSAFISCQQGGEFAAPSTGNCFGFSGPGESTFRPATRALRLQR